MGLDILYRDGKIRKGYGGIILGDYCLGEERWIGKNLSNICNGRIFFDLCSMFWLVIILFFTLIFIWLLD